MSRAILGFVAAACLTLVLLGASGTSGVPAGAAAKGKTVLVIHGGAGVLTDKEMKDEKITRKQFEDGLVDSLSTGYRVWKKKGSTSVEVVEAAIRVMEDCELFNAGQGAAISNDGRAELDAAIMEGNMKAPKEALDGKLDTRKRAGAVAAVTHIKNPISAARAVMEMKGHRHTLLVGEGAEWFALSEENRKRYALEAVSNVSFWTDRRLRQIRKEVEREGGEKSKKGAGGKERGRADRYFGTVGAAARKDDTLAAGTSTGGLTNKLRGRVGDSPLIGAGTYADDRACGVSCTGTGEVFIRHAVAHDVVARMLYKKLSVGKAAEETIAELPDEDEGVGGLIALDNSGRHAFAMSARSVGMYRGFVTEEGDIYVAVFRTDTPRSRKPGEGRPRRGGRE